MDPIEKEEIMSGARMFSAISSAAAASMLLGVNSSVHTEGKERKSVYENPEPSPLIQEEPLGLQGAVQKARLTTLNTLNQIHAKSLETKEKVVAAENELIGKMKEIISKEDNLLPNGIWVGVAALAGVVASRNRNIIIRAASPILFATLASSYLLPRTTNNIFREFERVEQRWPPLSDMHKKVSNTVEQSKLDAKEAWQWIGKEIEYVRGEIEDGLRRFEQQATKKRVQVGEKVEGVKEKVTVAAEKNT
ncbi:uncharacterized protein VTP21DRAFT_11493 [Calcarisporiella thermophila]|uniref:uncharacterized protein n=1 Tax=Calcarisporiella thermophila TaxID=911321 RepID=UPI0037421893